MEVECSLSEEHHAYFGLQFFQKATGFILPGHCVIVKLFFVKIRLKVHIIVIANVIHTLCNQQ